MTEIPSEAYLVLFSASGTSGDYRGVCPALASSTLRACKETVQVWSPTNPRPAPRRPWVKTKCLNRAEFVVIGWSDPEGSRPYVGALLLGYYESDGRLVCAGRVGTGMSQKTLRVGRAILWMSHQPMISLRSSPEFIAALPSPGHGPSSAFGSFPLVSAISGRGTHTRVVSSAATLPMRVAEDHPRRRFPSPAGSAPQT
jgi:hypothetical protein